MNRQTSPIDKKKTGLRNYFNTNTPNGRLNVNLKNSIYGSNRVFMIHSILIINFSA